MNMEEMNRKEFKYVKSVFMPDQYSNTAATGYVLLIGLSKESGAFSKSDFVKALRHLKPERCILKLEGKDKIIFGFKNVQNNIWADRINDFENRLRNLKKEGGVK